MVRRPTDAIDGYRLIRHRGDYVAKWDEDGKPRQAKLGIATAAPTEVAKGAFAEWVRMRKAALAQYIPLTVGEIVGRYLDALEVDGKPSVERMRQNWKALRPTFENLKPADLEAPFEVRGETRTRCHAYAVERQTAGRARYTIWTELNMLRSAMNWAASKRAKLIAEAPFVWVPKAGKKRKTHLTDAEALRLLECAGSYHVRLVLLIALLTGARKTAICELTWDRVDFDRSTINFEDDELEDDILVSGHQKGRAFVDMHPILHAALHEAKEYARTKFVIEWQGKQVANPKKAIWNAVERAGLRGRYIGAHALRHTLATWAANRKVSMRQIQKMLGHEDIRTTEKFYASHMPGYTLEVAESVNLPEMDKMVGGRGIEPLTPSMSTKCSTSELTALKLQPNGCAENEEKGV